MWSRDTGQQIPCFERCQLIITWMSNIKEVHGKPRLHVCQPIIWSMVAILGNSVTVVAVLCTCPQAIPLAMITMRKSTHGFFFFFPIWVWGSTWRPFRPPELCYNMHCTVMDMNSIQSGGAYDSQSVELHHCRLFWISLAGIYWLQKWETHFFLISHIGIRVWRV